MTLERARGRSDLTEVEAMTWASKLESIMLCPFFSSLCEDALLDNVMGRDFEGRTRKGVEACYLATHTVDQSACTEP